MARCIWLFILILASLAQQHLVSDLVSVREAFLVLICIVLDYEFLLACTDQFPIGHMLHIEDHVPV